MIGIEEDGDVICAPTKHCTQCRIGFTPAGKPKYPELVKLGRFWCCPICKGSYGESPHPDLR